MVKRYEEAGANVHLLSPSGSRPIGIKDTTTFLWRGLKKIVRTEKPQVAHVQYMAPGAIPILILRALGVKKILATSHTDADIYSPNGLRVIRFLTRYVLSGFQCITETAERGYFGSSHIFDGKKTKHFTIYNSLPDHISIRTEPKPFPNPIRKRQLPSCRQESLPDPLTIGVVSRLEKIKGMDLVVPAFAEVSKKHPNIRLLVVGDGSLRSQMESQAKQYDIVDRVEFTGRLPQSELQAQYDRIDILLMPSRSEGFGLTALEGMARGCVPIVANVGGLPEVVQDGINGLLHKPDSVSDIADKIIILLNNPESLMRVSKSAISKAQDFSFTNYQNSIKRLYSNL